MELAPTPRPRFGYQDQQCNFSIAGVTTARDGERLP